ncbi:MAG: hypothetical protein MPEBLZ_01887 [Candidatus Methanoperedens nitroreducens]|uniref:Uncharacterized protein n=1 Tax=Candidatus Methanoperedens nitratireducens TaxID=1392998 RepID=A0A0P8C9P4_9EURY|nr:DUF6516 family protein [Candidatus Methanoperedens sp. BLZ2]KAB2946753.1 MAG: hypothetical protein F9K14_06255 [Candidatus Methanoperedens sp.]KPQ43505.1 MAG: hypothetical protein MPEBLZ_01887 [Candidatus Methanoperedens sp. BLZ1]MBZ0175827.1 DUF6516 family protein [Candidatus Methanoperedens nitroreducens]CAG0996063.1 hypothetical protein METP2_02922 [Methanosarcinales archaeon]MCX9079285.1 DUF6516 family protein [Candidatus Methanoperedens sp.]
MFLTYQTLKQISEDEFSHIVRKTRFIGGRSAEPNKLRMYFIDGSFLDVWLSEESDYSYHWEQRAQRGLIHRWDNAPDHPEIESFPDHFHDGTENNILSSELDRDSTHAFRQVLGFIEKKLKELKTSGD